mgnify:CR=1 FL=1
MEVYKRFYIVNAMLTCKTNRELLLPYALPYIVWVLVFTLLNGWLDMAWIYALRTVVVTALLWYFRKCYLSIFSGHSRSNSIFMGICWGILGCVLWVMLVAPFISDNVLAWDTLPFFIRVTSAAFLVPVFEELLMRGYLFRLASQWEQFRKRKDALALALDHGSIAAGTEPSWSMPAVVVSTVFFTMGHSIHEWPAAFAYGLLMAFLLIRTGGLLACIIAHGTTNLALGIYVWFTGQWGLW